MNETRALAQLASIIGRSQGLNVVFDHRMKTAATDGKTILLPVVSNLGNEDHAALIYGLVDHEAMHCRYTDFSVLNASNDPDIVKGLANLFEDVWGEREQATIYPGCARNIRKAMEVMIDLKWYQGPDASRPESPANTMINFLINSLLARLYDLPQLVQFTEAYRATFEGLVGRELVEKVWVTACKIDDVQSTEKAFALAREVFALLQEAADDASGSSSQGRNQANSQDQQSTDGKSGNTGNQDASSGSQPAQQPGTQPTPSSSQGSGQQQSPDGTNGTQDARPGSQPGQQPGTQPGTGASTLPGDGPQPGQQPGTQPGSGGSHEGGSKRSEVIQGILGARGDDLSAGDMGDRLLNALKGEGKIGPDLDAKQCSHATMLGAHGSPGGSSYYPDEKATDVSEVPDSTSATAVAAAKPIAIGIGAKLETLLEARSETLVLHKRAGRRLESNRVPRVAVGKLDVFRTRVESKALDTAVYFLVDCSGSMMTNFAGASVGSEGVTTKDLRVVSAGAVAYAAAQVLDKHDIPFGIALFGSSHQRVKDLDGRWSVSRRLAMTADLGGTATDLAVIRVIGELMHRDEQRKLVVLATDGEPNSEEAAVAVMNEARLLGIEFAVLFIGAGGKVFERHLKSDGYTVVRAITPEGLTTAFFAAVQSAF